MSRVVRTKRVALVCESLDRATRARRAPEFEIQVREIQQRLSDSRRPARAPSHVDGGLETAKRGDEIASTLRDPGQIEAHRGDATGIAGGLCGIERFEIGRLRQLEFVVALQGHRERSERDRKESLVGGFSSQTHRVGERALRFLVVAPVALTQPYHGKRIRHDRATRYD